MKTILLTENQYLALESLLYDHGNKKLDSGYDDNIKYWAIFGQENSARTFYVYQRNDKFEYWHIDQDAPLVKRSKA